MVTGYLCVCVCMSEIKHTHDGITEYRKAEQPTQNLVLSVGVYVEIMPCITICWRLTEMDLGVWADSTLTMSNVTKVMCLCGKEVHLRGGLC